MSLIRDANGNFFRAAPSTPSMLPAATAGAPTLDYLETWARNVPPRLRKLAEVTLDFCRIDLGMPSMDLRWYQAGTPPAGITWTKAWNSVPANGCYHFAEPYTCWINAGIDLEDAARAVLHECKHIAQTATRGTIDAGDRAEVAQRELEARAYAESRMAQIQAGGRIEPQSIRTRPYIPKMALGGGR